MLARLIVTQIADIRRLVPAMVLTGLLAATGCGGDSDSGPTDPPPPPPSDPTTGSIQVAVASAGQDIDGNGYSIYLDGSPKAAIGVNGTVTLSDLTPGTHSVAIEGLAVNCTLASDNPVSVSVTAGATADASFAVSCVAAVGSLEVSISTTGEALDDDGYVITVIGGPAGAVDSNGSVTLTDVPVGNRSVQLSGINANCDVVGPNPKAVVMAFGQTTQVAFELTCVLPPPGTIAFLSEGRNNPQGEIFLMNAAGGDLRQITDMPDAGEKNRSTLSPDGQKVMFSVHPAGSNAELWVVNADGTGLLNLTNSPYQEEALNAAWSPDGTKIAFSRTGDSQECAAAPDACGWWIINTDGNGLIRLIPDGGDGFQGSTPQWSPDGSRLVFTGWVPDGNPGDPYFDLFVVNSDGSGLVQLTIGEDRYAFPTWSPDGNQIAYTTCCSGDYSHLYIMAPDGTGQQQLTDDALGWDAGAPVWSPDGSKILFSCTGMCLISPDGSGLVNFTELYAGPTVSNLPAWSPDGSVIGFSSDVGTGYDVFTIRPDGTGLRNLTNSPLDDSFGSWGP